MKRQSREVHSEQTSNSMTFSTKSAGGSNVSQTFAKQQHSSEQKSFSSTHQQQNQFSAVRQEQKQSTQFSSSSMTSSQQQHQQSMTSSTTSSSNMMAQKMVADAWVAASQKPAGVLENASVEHHGEEIRQESLKSTLQSAITDLEQDLGGIKSPTPPQPVTQPTPVSEPAYQDKETWLHLPASKSSHHRRNLKFFHPHLSWQVHRKSILPPPRT